MLSAEREQPLPLSLFFSVSLSSISLSQSEQHRGGWLRAVVKPTYRMFGRERESKTLAYIVQNPSDTPSHTKTQMTRKNRKWSHCLEAPLPLSAASLLHQSPGQIHFGKRMPQGEKECLRRKNDIDGVKLQQWYEPAGCVQLLLPSSSSNSSPFFTLFHADGQCTDNQVIWLTGPVVCWSFHSQLKNQTQT